MQGSDKEGRGTQALGYLAARWVPEAQPFAGASDSNWRKFLTALLPASRAMVEGECCMTVQLTLFSLLECVGTISVLIPGFFMEFELLKPQNTFFEEKMFQQRVSRVSRLEHHFVRIQ